MTVAACHNCGAKDDVRCVDDRCCDRDDRDEAFLQSMGQNWQFRANVMLDAWVDACIALADRKVELADAQDAVDRAQENERVAKSRFDGFMREQLKSRLMAAARAAPADDAA